MALSSSSREAILVPSMCYKKVWTVFILVVDPYYEPSFILNHF